jgi:uncharacterized Zn-binding protein involved in type VI secretion
MRPEARVGDLVLCPKCGVAKIVSGSRSYLVDMRPSVRLGDRHTKGKIITGNKEFLIDMRPSVRVGDKAICKCKKGVTIGRVIRGSRDVFTR